MSSEHQTYLEKLDTWTGSVLKYGVRTDKWLKKVSSRRMTWGDYASVPPERIIPYSQLGTETKALLASYPIHHNDFNADPTQPFTKIGETELRNVVVVDDNGEILGQYAEVVDSDGAVIVPFRKTPAGRIEILTTREEREHLMVFSQNDPNYNVSLPMGHFEEGEDPETGALRELKEETGILEVRGKELAVQIADNFTPYLGTRNIYVYCVEIEYGAKTGQPSHNPDERINETTWRDLTEACRIILSGPNRYAAYGCMFFLNWAKKNKIASPQVLWEATKDFPLEFPKF